MNTLPSPMHEPPTRRRILLVDDDRAHSEGLARALRRRHDVVVADSARAAIAALERETFDAVVTDFSMPGGDGVELLEVVRARWSTVRRVLVSGGEVPPLEEAEASGLVQRFFVKPVFVRELMQVIEAAHS